jgi:hypothetical protein
VEKVNSVLHNWEEDEQAGSTQFINLHKMEVMSKIYDWFNISTHAQYSSTLRRIHTIRHFLLYGIAAPPGLELWALARQVCCASSIQSMEIQCV